MAQDVNQLLLELVKLRVRYRLEVMGAFQPGMNGNQQFLGIEGLSEVIFDTHSLAFENIVAVPFGGQKNEGNAYPLRISPHFLVEFIAVHLGHHDVGENQIGAGLLHHVQGSEAVAGGKHLETIHLQDFPHGPLQQMVIFYDQDALFVHLWFLPHFS